MKASYNFIDHTADVLFEAQAASLSELFVQCALALEETQVDTEKIDPKEKILITGKNSNLERLLFDFLDDVLFYKDSELLVFNKFDITIDQKDSEFYLTCNAHGEKLDFSKHDPKVDVKAITMHMFEVKKLDNGWKARVLIDI